MIDVEVSRLLLNLFAWRRMSENGAGRTAEGACQLAVEIISGIDARMPHEAEPISAAVCDVPPPEPWLAATAEY